MPNAPFSDSISFESIIDRWNEPRTEKSETTSLKSIQRVGGGFGCGVLATGIESNYDAGTERTRSRAKQFKVVASMGASHIWWERMLRC